MFTLETQTQTVGFKVVQETYILKHFVEKIIDDTKFWDSMKGEFVYNKITAIKNIRCTYKIGLKDAIEIIEYTMKEMRITQ